MFGHMLVGREMGQWVIEIVVGLRILEFFNPSLLNIDNPLTHHISDIFTTYLFSLLKI